MSEFDPIAIASKVSALFEDFTQEQAGEIILNCATDTACLDELFTSLDCDEVLNPLYVENFATQLDQLFDYFEGEEQAVFTAIASTVLSLPVFKEDPDFCED
jgi:hypothetical protein